MKVHSLRSQDWLSLVKCTLIGKTGKTGFALCVAWNEFKKPSDYVREELSLQQEEAL